MSWNRPTLCLFLISSFLGLTACHNNAHLRTQKIIEPGEKVYSVSGIVAVGGGEGRYATGISGFRGEVSMLSGREDGEAGPYLGLGVVESGGFDFIAGYEYKRYSKTGIPKKLGVQAELNFTPGDDDDTYGFQGGTVLHLRPSYTSTTAKGRPLYAGVHGLLALGNLTERNYNYNYYSNSSYSSSLIYQFTSIGAGLTAGAEIILQSSSLQFQLDAGLVKNSFSNFSAEEYESQYGEEPSQTTFIVTGSAGMNFFKPAPKTKLPTAPYPVPYYYEEEETYEQEAEPEPVLKFDPETGLPIEKEPELQFDPETGEPIELEENIKFDPETGEPIPAEDKLEYDPETGELIVPGLLKPVLEKVLLGGMKADLRLVDGISIADATLWSLQGYMVMVNYDQNYASPNTSLIRNRRMNREINLSQISSITVAGGTKGIAGALLGCIGGGIMGFGLPFLLAMVTESFEMIIIGLIGGPLGMLTGATSGYKKTATETYDLSTMNREAKRSMIITLSKRTLG